MTLIGLIVLLLIVGFAVWLIRFLPIDQTFKTIAIGVIVFFMVMYILAALFPGSMPHIRLK